jgi:hypothetical protein
MHEGVQLMRDVRTVVASADHEPTRTVTIVQLAFDVSRHLTHLLVVFDVCERRNLLDGLVGDVHSLTFHLGRHVGCFD